MKTKYLNKFDVLHSIIQKANTANAILYHQLNIIQRILKVSDDESGIKAITSESKNNNSSQIKFTLIVEKEISEEEEYNILLIFPKAIIETESGKENPYNAMKEDCYTLITIYEEDFI